MNAKKKREINVENFFTLPKIFNISEKYSMKIIKFGYCSYLWQILHKNAFKMLETIRCVEFIVQSFLTDSMCLCLPQMFAGIFYLHKVFARK